MKKNKKRRDVVVGLVHWPIVDRAGKEVVTNVTNLDVHDIARACRTYGASKYFIINRLEEQLMFVSRMLNHWRVGRGSVLNPMRKTALGMVVTAETLEKALEQWDLRPIVVGTAARNLKTPAEINFKQLREKIYEFDEEEDDRDVFLIFGTGNGLHEKILRQCDYLLEPIEGDSEDCYKHLSVRSAVSICLDRLLGKW